MPVSWIAYSLGHLTGDIGTMVIPGAGVAGKIGTVAKIAEDAGKATKLAKLAGKVVKAASKAKTAITAAKIAGKVKKAVINSAKVTAAVVKGTAKYFVDPKQLAKVANSTGFMGTPAIKHAADSLAAGVKAGAKEAKKINKAHPIVKIPTKKISDLPNDVKKAYNGYSKSGWKGQYKGQNATKGTMAGGTYKNGTIPKLPSITPENKTIVYKEFDVHNKSVAGGRDSQRFVVGSDGRVYFTEDHYATWVEVLK